MRLLVTDAAAQPPRQATAWLIMTLGRNMNSAHNERYDAVFAAFSGGWGPARSVAGVVGALAVGYLTVGYADLFDGDAAGIPSRAGWIAFTGPLFFLTIPFFLYCLFVGVIRDGASILILLHLASLQSLNTSLNYRDGITLPLAALNIGMLAFDAYLLFRIHRLGRVTNHPDASAFRDARFLFAGFGILQLIFIIHFTWTEVTIITPSILHTFLRIGAISIPSLACAVLAIYAIASSYSQTLNTENEPNQ